MASLAQTVGGRVRPWSRRAAAISRGLACAGSVLALLVLPACQAGGVPPLRVGIPGWAPAACAKVGSELGFFDDEQVEIVEYGSPIELARHFREGSLDAAALTLDFVPYLAQSVPSLDVVFVIDLSSGADGIVASRGIEDVAGLRGKRIAVESSPLGAHVLLRGLKTAGLVPRDVVPVSVDAEDQADAFRNGSVDAVVTYEPDRTELIAAGAVPLFDSSQIPGRIVDVLIVPTPVAAERAAELRRLLDGWIAAFAKLQDDRASMVARLAASLAVDAATVEKALGGVRLGDLAINRDLLAGSSPKLAATLEEIQALASSAGLLPATQRRGVRFTDAYLPTVVARTTGRLTAGAAP